jgi:PAS domain-containing protein
VNDVPIDLVAAVLNSMAFDYCLRFRTAGMHLSFNYMMRLPIVSSVKNNGLTTVSGGAGRICHIAELADSALKVWQLNRAVAEAYGLSPDDFEHVLSAFTVFIRKRPEFFAFMRSRANEWKEGSPYFIDRSKHYVAGAEQESWAAEKSRAKYSHDQQSGKTRIGK